jgi:hypothetical protein
MDIYIKKRINIMFELTWQEFSRRQHIAKLPLHEQMRQFQQEQQRYQLMMEYVINTTTAAAAACGAAAGGGTASPSTGENNYVDDYVDDYFE